MLRSDCLWGDMIPIHVTITVETPAPLRNTNPSLRLGNLSTASDVRTLRSTLEREFGAFGPLRDINMPLDRVTRNIRGFAFIEFRSPADAERAITALRGSLRIGERDIRVEYAASQRKSAEEMASIV
jgi:RNA recognition motif-containing protein